MTRAFTLRALLSRWRRLGLTAITVGFGVGIATGTLIFTDSTRAAYHRLFAQADGGAQLIVSARQSPGTGAGSGSAAARIPAAPTITPALARRIRRVPGVAAVAGTLIAPATIVGRDGRPLDASPATVAESTLPPRFAGPRYLSGRAPRGPRRVAIDATTARQQGWHVGTVIEVATSLAAARFRISGIVSLGAEGGERLVLFPPAEAARLYQSADVNQLDLRLSRGANPTVVRAAVARRLPPSLTVTGQAGEIALAIAQISTAFSTLRASLVAFSFVALLIGALVIFNTFAITATQRRRELAVLRALGATRGQVVLAGLVEAGVCGLLGAAVGVGLGPLVALVVRALFAGTGVGVASGALSVSAGTALLGLAVGVGVSLVAALFPALGAGAVAPAEALRRAQGAVVRGPRRLSTGLRLSGAAGLWAGGLGLTLSAGGDEAHRLLVAGVGTGLLLAGALLIGPLLVSALVVLTRLRRADPIFALAREQALLDRGRTALSSSSLMIGIALVLVIAVYVHGLRSATAAAIRTTVTGDVAIENVDGSSPIPAASVQAAAAVPDLAAVSSLKTVTGRLGGVGTVQIAGVDPTSWGQVYRFAWVPRASASLDTLSGSAGFVEADVARARHLAIGSRLALRGPNGRQVVLSVAGIYRDRGLLAGVVLPRARFDAEFAQPELQAVFINLTGTVRRSVAVGVLRRALVRFPGVVVRDQRALASRLAANVSGVVDLLYALLVLAVVMSLLGIGGALNLTVVSRSAELGTLRALGMTPGQAAALVRDESCLTALVGGVGGVALGLVISVVVCDALSPEGLRFAVPWPALVGSVLAAVVAGLGAALWPARRASRLRMLAAIAEE